MKQHTRYIILFGIIVVLVGLFAWYKATPGKYDTLAQCLGDQGVTFFGAFWCPHCQEAKQKFGKSMKYLNYTECSTPDGKGQQQVCKDARIAGYPTWEYPNTITVAKSESDTSFACSSAEGLAEDDCSGAAPEAWHLTAGGHGFISPTKPTSSDTLWTLPAHSRSIGTTDPLAIAALASCNVN